LKLPVVDVSEVGAGGGSIVRVDAGGALKVGPDIAGAIPGPACYGRGGTQPTVTDASVVLGYLNPHALAGGTVPIDAQRSHVCLQEIADSVKRDVLEVAFGIHRLSNSTMMRAVKAVSTYRGRDPRDYALFAFGGNGGIHATAVAQELQIRRVIVPPAAGVFSAVGLLCADLEAVRSAAFLRPLDGQSAMEATRQFRVLERQALEELGGSERATLRWRAELRYAGQGFELSIELPGRPTKSSTSSNPATLGDADQAIDAGALRAAFEREYARTYGHCLSGHAIDFVALRVIATVAPQGSQTMTGIRQPQGGRPIYGSRLAYFGAEHGLIDTAVIDRLELSSSSRPGPVIIEEYEGTTVVPPQAQVSRDALDNIVIELPAEGRSAH
jgi:N-methylhydantoinase A